MGSRRWPWALALAAVVVVATVVATRAGHHLVATTEGEGLYGVGPKAELTWFQPGTGTVGDHNDDVAVQASQDKRSVTVFSLDDGKTITPAFPAGADVESLMFFQGGFAAQFSDATAKFTQFFDTSGKPASDERVDGLYIGGSTANLTAVIESEGFAIYGPQGDKLLHTAGEAPRGLQLIGTTLWIGDASSAEGTRFQPFDMRTGNKGKPCQFDLVDGFLGTDGSVFVRAPTNPRSDDLAKAYDLATCELTWEVPRPVGSLGRVQRIGDTLARLSDDGTELMSLVPPR